LEKKNPHQQQKQGRYVRRVWSERQGGKKNETNNIFSVCEIVKTIVRCGQVLGEKKNTLFCSLKDFFLSSGLMARFGQWL
jgi:hypothetical protein